MAESATSLFRRGMISSKQAGKLKALAGTKTNPSWVGSDATASGDGANFMSRKGKNDQGGRRDSGHSGVAGVGHINAKSAADIGSPARASGRPSRGGTTFNRNNDVPDYEQIDEGSEQKPNFPRGAGVLGKKAQQGYVKVQTKRLATKTRGNHGANDRGPDNRVPKRARGGAVYPSGGEYGGPNGRP